MIPWSAFTLLFIRLVIITFLYFLFRCCEKEDKIRRRNDWSKWLLPSESQAAESTHLASEGLENTAPAALMNSEVCENDFCDKGEVRDLLTVNEDEVNKEQSVKHSSIADECKNYNGATDDSNVKSASVASEDIKLAKPGGYMPGKHCLLRCSLSAELYWLSMPSGMVT